jgi:hypothetical protein
MGGSGGPAVPDPNVGKNANGKSNDAGYVWLAKLAAAVHDRATSNFQSGKNWEAFANHGPDRDGVDLFLKNVERYLGKSTMDEISRELPEDSKIPSDEKSARVENVNQDVKARIAGVIKRIMDATNGHMPKDFMYSRGATEITSKNAEDCISTLEGLYPTNVKTGM